MLIGLSVYFSTKSKNTITILNRLGLSISYDKVLRIRARLAAYALKISENQMPIPSHFDTNGYVTVAFDNFDHNEALISGLGLSHDTVIVFFSRHS